MSRPLRIQYPGAFYHVTCRGNERRKIFINDDDRYRFLKLLAESLETYQVVLYAYVMMSNHFHLVVQTMRANLSEFMRRFNICYTGWFNYHHNTCGHLYQGRYKAFLVDADNYLLQLSRYIHLNPVHVGKPRGTNYYERWQYLQQYQWSSLPGYISEKKGVKFVDYRMVLKMVGSRRLYRQFVADGLTKGTEDPFKDVQYQIILGDKDFVALVKSKYIEKGSLRDQPSYRKMTTETIGPEYVLRAVSKVFGVSDDIVCQRRGNGIIRGVCAEILYRYSDMSLRKIGEVMGGIDYGGVHQLRRRLHQYMEKDESLKEKYNAVERIISQFSSK